MNVILYSTHCPMCRVLEKKLNNKNVEYTLIDDQNIMLEKGMKSAPMLEVDGELMAFKPAVTWVDNLGGEA